MTEQTEKKARRPRTVRKLKYQIETLTDGGLWCDTDPADPLAGEVHSEESEARKSLTRSAIDGQTYRIVKVMWEGKVAVEKVDKRKLI